MKSGRSRSELSDAVADHMNVRRGEVHEVVSFYSFLDVPTDAVRVCVGPVCDCLGAKDVLAREQEQASGVPVLGVECLGHCELAPVLLRGDSIEPEAVHRTNDGPSLALGSRDATLADYERRGGLTTLRSLPENEQIIAELKGVRPRRSRWRRLPDRAQVGSRREGGRPPVRDRER